jgi:hypothetical protein
VKITSRLECESFEHIYELHINVPTCVEMMCIVLWKMEKTFSSFVQTGRMLSFGINGLNLESNAFQKVCDLQYGCMIYS